MAVSVFHFYAVYGVQADFYFTAEAGVASSSKVLAAAAPWIAGEVVASKDGGAGANVTNLPTRVGATSFYKITLTAAELQARRTFLSFSNAANTAADVAIVVETSLEVGKMVADASLMAAGTNGVLYQGSGDGAGLKAIGGDPGAGNASFGIHARTGPRGGAGFLCDGAGVNTGGITAVGSGTAAGATFRGGTSGEGFNCAGQGAAAGFHAITATGVGFKASATGADGVGASFEGGPSGVDAFGIHVSSVAAAASIAVTNAGDGNGIYVESNGIGAAVTFAGAGTGNGMTIYSDTQDAVVLTAGVTGGATSGLVSLGGNAGVGILARGGATGAGAIFRGGATSGIGLICDAQSGNSHGAFFDGRGTGAGLATNAAGTGVGLVASAAGGATKLTTLFNQIENATADPGYVPGSNTIENLLVLVARRFLSKVELVKSSPGVGTLTVYARDGVTVLAEGPVTEDLTTQTIGPLG